MTAGGSTPSFFGDGLDNEIVIARDSLGVISVVGEVPLAGGIPGGFPADFNTPEILVLGMGGSDLIELGEADGPLPSARLFGGSGDNVLLGGSGGDSLFRQGGSDLADGGGGDGSAFLGSSDDSYLWNRGDGLDGGDGEGGDDYLRFNGSDDADEAELSGVGGRLQLAHDLGLDGIDASRLERLEVNVEGGADTVTLNDLTGAGVVEVAIDLGSLPGPGDGAEGVVVVNGSAGNDVLLGGDDLGEQVLSAKGALLRLGGSDGPTDQLRINGLGEAYRIDLLFLEPDSFQVIIDGGDGNDSITGTVSDDMLIGAKGTTLSGPRSATTSHSAGPATTPFRGPPVTSSSTAGTGSTSSTGSSATTSSPMVGP